ncbi:MAG: tetratricopeptide repeat protein [Myxococcota bacterium]
MRSTLRIALTGLLLATLVACEAGPRLEDVRALQAEGRFEASLAPLRALLEATPEDPEVHFLYGRALNRTANSPVAFWSLEKAAEDPRWHVAAKLELASATLRNGDFGRAIAHADTVLETDPGSVAALGLRGMARLNEGLAEAALSDFDALLERRPEDESALASRAAALLLLSRVDEAAEAIAAIDGPDSAGAAGPSGGLVCATRATLEAERGDVEAASSAFEACLEAHPLDPTVVAQSIAFFDATGSRARGSEVLAAVLGAAPGSHAYRKQLADRALAAGDPDRAEAVLLAGTQRPDARTRAAAWTDLTNFYLGRDALDAAIEAYRQAIEHAPRPSQLGLLTLADLLARAERHAEALEIAAGLERDAYRGLIEARVHLNEGRPREALARLDQVFPTWPNNAGARYYAARAAEQIGDFTRAVEEYRQSIRSGPEQTEAALRLSKLYFHAGAFQNAWNSAAQHFRQHRDDAEGIRMMLRAASSAESESVANLLERLASGPHWPVALAMRAERIEETDGPEAALAVFDAAKGLDLTRPANAEALRTRVRLLGKLDRHALALAETEAALDAEPGSSAFHEIRGHALAASDAPEAQVRARLEAAIELAPRDWRALLALGRHLEASGETARALELLFRAVEAAPGESAPGRALARALTADGRREDAETAWQQQLREQPWDAEAALALARMRLARSETDDRTLELAERAVLFGGGETALDTLVATHESRGESARVQALSEAARNARPITPTRVTPVEGPST